MSWLLADEDDPRHWLTETGFRVDQDLLGRPLAHPLRRLAALLLDLAAVGGIVLSKVISPWLFALVGGWLLWRVADPEADIRLPSEGLRIAFRVAALGTAGVAAVVMVAGMFGGGETAGSEAAESAAAPDSAAAAVRSLRSAGSVDSAVERAAGHALELYRGGAPRDEVAARLEELLEETAEEGAGGWSSSWEQVRDRALARLDSAASRRAAVRDSLRTSLAAALRERDTARVTDLASRLLGAPRPPGSRQLRARVEHLESELERARRPPSVLEAAWGTLNDFGLGLGWLGTYFTAFLTLWRGRTPGKRLLGIRVVRIDGEPVTTWDAFSRFGGYAAGVLTGLLGFAQVLWHPNRQGVHDRIAGTVVIEER